jgi:hypothetical protein
MGIALPTPKFEFVETYDAFEPYVTLDILTSPKTAAPPPAHANNESQAIGTDKVGLIFWMS